MPNTSQIMWHVYKREVLTIGGYVFFFNLTFPVIIFFKFMHGTVFCIKEPKLLPPRLLILPKCTDDYKMVLIV